MDVAGRLPRLQARLDDLGCDGLVVSNLVNIRYLTGFTGSAALLLVARDEAMLVSDGRYRDQALEQITASGVAADIEIGRPAEQVDAIARRSKQMRRVGLEGDDISWGAQQRLASSLTAHPELVSLRSAVETLRMVKDAGELARIERAADIADVALAQVKELLVDGMTEQEFAIALDFEMRRRGAEGVAFETIVASGPNGALPHARPTERRIEPGELVVVDFGALIDGYRSDMTRTLSIGEVRSGELADALSAVLSAQRAGVSALRPGITGAELDSVCRSSLAAAGFGEAFLHGTGHGVGLDIHEAPAISTGSTDTLAVGAVVTVEPGVYLHAIGGARIEDTLVVTETGARPLTKSTKDHTL